MGKKYDLPDVFKRKADDYFKKCDKGGVPYTFSGLCLHLGICKQTFSEYSKDGQFLESCRYIKLKIENFLEEKALFNQVNGHMAQFTLRNNFGWVDKQVVESTSSAVYATPDEYRNYLIEFDKQKALKIEDPDDEKEWDPREDNKNVNSI